MKNTSISEDTITIGDVIRDYDALKSCVAGDALRNLVESAIYTSADGGFIQNDTYFHALFLTEMMLERTNKSLRIFCGRDVARFLNTIRDTFFKCCERIKNSNGKIRIISKVCSDSDKKNSLDNLKRLANEVRNSFSGIDIKGVVQKANSSDENHYIVCDSKMLRVEEIHKPLTDNMPASNIKAKVFFNNIGLAASFEADFDSLYEFK